jgi:hypothetical protein
MASRASCRQKKFVFGAGLATEGDPMVGVVKKPEKKRNHGLGHEIWSV